MTKQATRCKKCGSLLNDDGMSAAQRVIIAFGGATELADAAKIDKSSVYRWLYPKEKGGTNGAIPHANHGKILAAAEAIGLGVTRSDLV